MEPQATHIPVLISLITSFRKGSPLNILEVGTGPNSNLTLNALKQPQDYFLTLESSVAWYSGVTNNDKKLVPDWTKTPEDVVANNWDIVFIDNAPAIGRTQVVEQILNNNYCKENTIFVLHDSEPDKDNDYQYSKLNKHFSNIYLYNRLYPNTTLMTNRTDVNFPEIFANIL